jgi:hypothetical protein
MGPFGAHISSSVVGSKTFTGTAITGLLARKASTSTICNTDGGGACFLRAAKKLATFTILTVGAVVSITEAVDSAAGAKG